MGHMCDIISGDFGIIQRKIKALNDTGVFFPNTPWEVPNLIKEIF